MKFKYGRDEISTKVAEDAGKHAVFNEKFMLSNIAEQVKAQAMPEGVEGVVVVEASEWVEDNQWVFAVGIIIIWFNNYVLKRRPLILFQLHLTSETLYH